MPHWGGIRKPDPDKPKRHGLLGIERLRSPYRWVPFAALFVAVVVLAFMDACSQQV